MKNIERRALKEQAPKRDRLRLVLGASAAYALYLRNFLYTPAMARRMDKNGMLTGRRPDRILVVMLEGWDKDAKTCPGLFSEVIEWRDRWRDMGVEQISEIELIGGMPVRKEKLYLKYEKLLDGCGSNNLAIESAKDWIARLDERDQTLLLKAINERKNAKMEAIKKDTITP